MLCICPLCLINKMNIDINQPVLSADAIEEKKNKLSARMAALGAKRKWVRRRSLIVAIGTLIVAIGTLVIAIIVNISFD